MTPKNKLNILAIYRSQLALNRGTPIRSRSILKELVGVPNVKLSVASWDEEGELELPNHFHLNNNHLEDVKKLISYIKKNDINVVIGHTMGTYYYLLPIKFFTKAKIVLEMHGFLEEEEKLYGKMKPLRYHRIRLVHGMFYRMCDLITTCSESATEFLRRYNKNTESLYGGVNLDFFNPDIKPSNRLSKSEDGIIIGYAGDSRKWQGLPFLVNGYEELRKEHKNFSLALLSSENRYDGGENIMRVGSVEHHEVAPFLAECDILILPRTDNPVNRITYPSKLMEYLAMGKAVVASRTSDCHKIIEHGVNGMLFDPGDTDGFIDVMLQLQDKELREKIGKGAYKTAKNYTWKKQGELVIGWLDRLF